MQASSDDALRKPELKFSVAMCVYKNDNPEHFKVALDSIINQTRQPDEIVLVIDGPVPDDLRETINVFSSNNKLLKPVFLEKNVGLGNALKVAVETCRNELIARMDSDDISLPERFEKQLDCFEKDHDLSIVGTNIKEFIDSPGNIVGIREVPQEDIKIREYIKNRCPLNHMSVMFRKEDVLKAGNYKDWFWNEDYYLWIRMLKVGCKFQNLSEALVNVRISNNTYKRRGGMRYFKSELALQKLMLSWSIINWSTYIHNVFVRFILQVVLPNTIRRLIFRKFARRKPQN